MIALILFSLLLELSPGLPAQTPRVLSVEDPVTFTGVGPVRLGMSIAKLQAATGVAVTIDEPAENGCTFAYTTDPSRRIAFMLSDGVVSRIDVEAPGFRTASGVRVGDSESRLRSLYAGRFRVTPHAYVEGHYITIRSRDRRFALVFETDGRVVTSFRVGRLPEVLWVEGCS